MIYEVAQQLGRICSPPNRPAVHRLTAVGADSARPNTYSSHFGYASFPFHTDMANWTTPPRYIVLRHCAGDTSVPTLLMNSRDVLTNERREDFERQIWSTRAQRRSFVVSVLADRQGVTLFRWDPVVLTPLSPGAAHVTEVLAKKLDRMALEDHVPIEFTPSSILVIDNWRILHGRPAIPEGAQSRELERVLVR